MSGTTRADVETLEFFPPLLADIENPPAKKLSLFDIFKKPKEKTVPESGRDVIFKSDLEFKARAEQNVESRSTFYVDTRRNEPSDQSLTSGAKGPLGDSGQGGKGHSEHHRDTGGGGGSISTTLGETANGEQGLQRDRGREQGGRGQGYAAQPPRSLSLVMKQISNLRKGQEQGGSRVRQYWMPDSQCKECYECGDKFTTFKRRHHCRVCGQVFCHACCKQEAAPNTVGLMEGERVCSYCSKVLRSYALSGGTTGDITALHEDLRKVSQESIHELSPPEGRRQRTGSLLESDFPETNPFEANPTSEDHVSDALDNNEWQLLLKDSPQLRDLWLLIQHPSNGISPQTHRYRLRNYHDCIVGSELVDWLLKKDKATNRDQATAIGQSLLEAKWLMTVPGQSDEMFRDDNFFYRMYKADDFETSTVVTEEGELAPKEYPSEPNWFQDTQPSDQTRISLMESGGLDAVGYDHLMRLDSRGVQEDEPDSVSIEPDETARSSKGSGGKSCI